MDSSYQQCHVLVSFQVEDYDPFQDIPAKDAEWRETKTLVAAKPYTITKMEKIEMYHPPPNGAGANILTPTLVVYYKVGNLSYKSILPKSFNTVSQKCIIAMNRLIQEKRGPKLVLYGHETTCHRNADVALLRHDEGKRLLYMHA